MGEWGEETDDISDYTDAVPDKRTSVRTLLLPTASMTSANSSYPDAILSLTAEATSEDNRHIFDQWANTYEQVSSLVGRYADDGSIICVSSASTVKSPMRQAYTRAGTRLEEWLKICVFE